MKSRIINFEQVLVSMSAIVLTLIASGYAMSLCSCKLYEPEVPEELLK